MDISIGLGLLSSAIVIVAEVDWFFFLIPLILILLRLSLRKSIVALRLEGLKLSQEQLAKIARVKCIMTNSLAVVARVFALLMVLPMVRIQGYRQNHCRKVCRGLSSRHDSRPR